MQLGHVPYYIYVILTIPQFPKYQNQSLVSNKLESTWL